MTRRLRGIDGALSVALGLGLLSGWAAAQAPKAPAAEKPAPQVVPAGVKVERDLEYVSGATQRQKLDLYVPEDARGPLPVVVWVHGGSWQRGSKDRCPAIDLTTRGYAVASINYRFSDTATFPAQIEDCRAAIRWLRGHARQYHLDPDHLGVWGASAGGHLVALLGTAADAKGWDGVGAHADQSARVQAVCDYFGPADFTGMKSAANSSVGKLLGGAVADRKDLARQASPVAYATKDDPPFLIIHGDHDALVPLHQSEMLYDALKQAGVDATFLVVKNGVHGPFDSKCEPKPEQIRETVFGFFDRHLKKANQ